jgi:hypothetical protein
MLGIKEEPRCSGALEGGLDHEASKRPVGFIPRHIYNSQPHNHIHITPALPGGDTMNIHDAFPSKYLKAEDLKGRKLTVIIEGVNKENVGQNKSEEPVMYFKNQQKALVLNKTNSMSVEEILGTAETDEWVGERITLYPTRVDYQGKRVPAIRVEAFTNGKGSPLPSGNATSPDIDDDLPY